MFSILMAVPRHHLKRLVPRDFLDSWQVNTGLHKMSDRHMAQWALPL